MLKPDDKIISQKTEHLLILLKAAMDYPYTGIEFERWSVIGEIIRIMEKRIERE